MLKHLYLIFGATFIFGILIGFLVFLASNSGKEGDGSIEPISKGTTIVAHAYGGCSRIGCPSYRIENNGAYVYIVRSPEGGEVRYEDTLTDRQLGIVREQVSDTDFERLLDTEFVGTCPITFDGLAYQYEIEYKGERHEVDSCVEVLAGEALFTTLEEYFRVFDILYAPE